MVTAPEKSSEAPPIEVVAGLETLIIGAGPSGLAAAACLRRRGRSFVLLERAGEVGSSWRNHYERLHLHTVKHFSHLPYRKFPDAYPTYPSRQQMVDYLVDYAEHFGIEPHFGQEVTSARRRNGSWHVRTESAVYQAEHLIVATGYNRRPKRPTWPGLEDFEGEVLHSSSYSRGDRFAGKSVMVVGIGNSGGEIAIDLWESGASPCICVRSPVHVVPREVYGIPAQVNGLLLDKLPFWLGEKLGDWLTRLVVGDLSPYGLRRPTSSPMRQVAERGKVPLIDIGTVDLIRQGALDVVPGVDHFTKEAAVFEDGTRRELDAVVLATGYAAALEEFLEDADQVTDARGYPVAHGRPAHLPGLFFVGYRNPITGALHDINLEAQRVGDHIAST